MKYYISDMSDWTTDEMVGYAKAIGKLRHLKPFSFNDFRNLPDRSQEAIYNLLVHIVHSNIEAANKIEDD